MIERACEILEVKPDCVKEFEAHDPFNGNSLIGVICRQSDHRYGALVIFKINDWKCEQVIFGTPKLEYPFDRDGIFHWPPVNQVEMWDKLDGTNILAYTYRDNNTEFLTYKTRLTPVLMDSKYGSFYSMWVEMLNEKEWIHHVIKNNPDYNLSFELYGSRNPITIQYDTPLDTRILFGVRKTDHVVKPPTELWGVEGNAPDYISHTPGSDLTDLYNSMRDSMSARNDGNLYCEGLVMYAHTGGPSWRMFKCKPEEIEKIHWVASGVIPKRDIWNTALNAFEGNEPDIDYLIELLLEEYTVALINKSRPRISRIFDEAIKHTEVVKSVNEVWRRAKQQGFDVTQDKAGTLRWMSRFFHKSQMRKVGSILLKQAGLL